MTQWIDGTSGLVLTETHAAGAATFTLTPSSGLDYPVSFFDGTEAVVPAAGISLTVPSGATLDATANFGFRLWFALFNNLDGTASLGVRKCSHTAGGIVSVNAPPEYLPLSTTAIDVNADVVHVFYTPTMLSATAWMWLSFATYEAGLATPGTWAASPSSISLINPYTPRPGAVLQTVDNQSSIGVTLTISGQSALMGNSILITPSSRANFIEAGIGSASIFGQVANVNGTITLRNTTLNRSLSNMQVYSTATQVLCSLSCRAYDITNTTIQMLYQPQANSINVSGNLTYSVYDIWAKEIMG